MSNSHSCHEMEWDSGKVSTHVYPLKQSSAGDLDDIIDMVQRVCLSEEMDWTPQMDPVDDLTQSFQSLHLAVTEEEEMDWMSKDASTVLIESLQCLKLGSVEEEMVEIA